jgi:cell wall-associated NlpC family hydrolase
VRQLVPALVFALACPGVAAAASVGTVNGVVVITGQDVATPAPVQRARHAPARRTAAKPAPAVVSDALARDVVRRALAYVGTPYRWGGTSPNTGFDCSGFVQYVFASAGIRIPRTADVQYAAGRPVEGYPQPGDLVFFQTYDYGASHVGIYLGEGWFVQEIAPNVHLSNFNASYFRSRYIGARRWLPT